MSIIGCSDGARSTCCNKLRSGNKQRSKTRKVQVIASERRRAQHLLLCAQLREVGAHVRDQLRDRVVDREGGARHEAVEVRQPLVQLRRDARARCGRLRVARAQRVHAQARRTLDQRVRHRRHKTRPRDRRRQRDPTVRHRSAHERQQRRLAPRFLPLLLRGRGARRLLRGRGGGLCLPRRLGCDRRLELLLAQLCAQRPCLRLRRALCRLHRQAHFAALRFLRLLPRLPVDGLALAPLATGAAHLLRALEVLLLPRLALGEVAVRVRERRP
jgi:hypothetical protein